jgi:hypothetical protein
MNSIIARRFSSAARTGNMLYHDAALPAASVWDSVPTIPGAALWRPFANFACWRGRSTGADPGITFPDAWVGVAYEELSLDADERKLPIPRRACPGRFQRSRYELRRPVGGGVPGVWYCCFDSPAASAAMMNESDREAPRKRILVVSFSQSGQLFEIVRSLLMPFCDKAEIEIIQAVLKPITSFPFPWPAYQFLDVFPESFQEIACPLERLDVDSRDRFDLAIIAYQVWYLSPSLPVSSFLQSEEGRCILRNTPVVTIVGARNMWYRAHERVKDHLRNADARLIGHIALTDRALNLVSVLTIVHWMLSGKKERWLGLLPQPGVAEKDIARCSAFGQIIARTISEPAIPNIQNSLNAAGACRVVPHLLALENAASGAFRIWSDLIRRQRGRRRRLLVRIFGMYLASGIALLSPLSFLLFYLALPFRRPAVQRQMQKVYDAAAEEKADD